MAEYEGNIRKMSGVLLDEVDYTLPLYDILEPKHKVKMTDLVGETIRLSYNGQINCVVTGKHIKKPFGEGMSYDAFMTSPWASPSIIRPELSRIHEGIALRDAEWEREHHLKPHVVYISLTSGLKVGVTRDTQIPSRWIDQGAVKAIRLSEVPYRQLAGLIEVELKEYMADKTNWRAMLKNEYDDTLDLIEAKDEMLGYLPDELQEYASDNDEIVEIKFPVIAFPEKVKSLKLDKAPIIEKRLMGIKGQYLIFDDNSVINLRSHSGYRIKLEA